MQGKRGDGGDGVFGMLDELVGKDVVIGILSSPGRKVGYSTFSAELRWDS